MIIFDMRSGQTSHYCRQLFLYFRCDKTVGMKQREEPYTKQRTNWIQLWPFFFVSTFKYTVLLLRNISIFNGFSVMGQ
jgi:hypothetical protein